MGKLSGKPNRLKFSIDGKFRSIEMFDRLKKFDRWKNSIEIFDRLKNSIDFLNRFALFRLDFSSDFLPKKRAILNKHEPVTIFNTFVLQINLRDTIKCACPITRDLIMQVCY